jgi:hypothetical protein
MNADNSEFDTAWHEANKTSDQNAVLGTGMAGKAESALKTRAYQLHVQEAKASGEQPMTPEEFAKSGK